MATPPETRPSTPGTPITSTARNVFDFDERLFAAAGDLDKQTNPPSNSKQELFVFQWLASVERELKRCGHVRYFFTLSLQAYSALFLFGGVRAFIFHLSIYTRVLIPLRLLLSCTQ